MIAVEAGAERHHRAVAGRAFLGREAAIGAERIVAIRDAGHGPGIGVAKSVGTRQNVANARPFQNPGVAALQPVIEPGQRLDMQAFPRPGQAVIAEHRDAHMLAVGQRVEGGECRGQMQRHILPIAAEIDRHLDPVQQRHEIAFVPPCIAQRALDRDGAPDIIPGMRIMMQLHQKLQRRHRGLAVHGGEFRCTAGRCSTVRAASRSLLRKNVSDSFDVMPTIARNGVTNELENRPW